jgi:hypothetical protein
MCGACPLGPDFDQLSMEAAATFNTPEYVAEANTLLGHSTTRWLLGDEVQEITTAYNPDEAGRDPS